MSPLNRKSWNSGGTEAVPEVGILASSLCASLSSAVFNWPGRIPGVRTPTSQVGARVNEGHAYRTLCFQRSPVKDSLAINCKQVTLSCGASLPDSRKDGVLNTEGCRGGSRWDDL